jgi:hypothetical protein
LDILFSSKEITEVYVDNCFEPQENYLIVSKDDAKRKFKEFLKVKKEVTAK